MRKLFVSKMTLAGLLAGIAIASIVIGCASKPPTKLEQGFFTIETNLAPVVSVRTNVVEVTLYRTNEQNVTVPVTLYETNVVRATNTVESYVYTPGPGAQRVGEVAGAVGNLFGVGGITTTAIGVLFSLWGYVRSKKNYVTAANIAQTVETMREFIRALPDGATYDNELVNWMQKHQAEEGVLNQVIDLITQQVSNPDAKVAADQVRATIEALKKTTG